MSAHADANELIAWMRQMPSGPRVTFVTHGEQNASDVLRQRIERELGWQALVPEFAETVALDGVAGHRDDKIAGHDVSARDASLYAVANDERTRTR